MILVFYLVLMPMKFEFSAETGVPAPKRVTPSRPFRRTFAFIFFAGLSLVVVGNIRQDRKKQNAGERAEPAKREAREKARRTDVSLPPLLVSLKGENGIRMARINVNLQVSRKAVKKEILSTNKAARKRLLVLLSGQKSRDLQNKKSHFEKQLLSWMNAFLSKGSVNKVTIQTTFLN